ncbi:hypothetical protein [Sigmofec virus UA08Rod_4774]|uniref:Uncharacterized protein n=1 Tax=Sigmofec virus UA08Rod_4774 TaxID=2929409 RepID=A0A976N0Y3_9VIRU|nr:hypothetical protein [Sigmofec virus UA08Rod_4774]
MINKRIYFRETLIIADTNPIEGKSLEEQIQAMKINGEPFNGVMAPLIYTRKRDGVMPAYNPRGDGFEEAIEAIDNITSAAMARRVELSKMKAEEIAKQAEQAEEPKTDA